VERGGNEICGRPFMNFGCCSVSLFPFSSMSKCSFCTIIFDGLTLDRGQWVIHLLILIDRRSQKFYKMVKCGCGEFCWSMF
jgi:hypothetical protein